jgi:hypothetical protein
LVRHSRHAGLTGSATSSDVEEHPAMIAKTNARLAASRNRVSIQSRYKGALVPAIGFEGEI